MADVDVQLVIQAVDEFSATLKKAAGETEKLGNAAKRGGEGAGGFAKGLNSMVNAAEAFVGAQIIQKFAQFVDSIFEIGGAAQRARNVLNAMTDGRAPEYITAIGRAARGTITDLDAMQIASRTLALGFINTADEMGQLTEVAAALGARMGISTTQMLDDLSRGIGRLSPMILDNAGIVYDANTVYSAYAATLGKSADELTRAERQQALLNLVLKEGGVAVAQTAGQADDSLAAWTRLKTGIVNTKNAVLEWFAVGLEPWLEGIQAIGAAKEEQRELAHTFVQTTDTVWEYNAAVREAGLNHAQLTIWQYNAAEAALAAEEAQRELATQTGVLSTNLYHAAEGNIILADTTERLTIVTQEMVDARERANEAARQQFGTNEQVAGSFLGLTEQLGAATQQWNSISDGAALYEATLRSMGATEQEILAFRIATGQQTGALTDETLALADAVSTLVAATDAGIISDTEAAELTADLANGNVEAYESVENYQRALEGQRDLQDEVGAGSITMAGRVSLGADTSAIKAEEIATSVDPVVARFEAAKTAVDNLRDALLALAGVRISLSVTVSATGITTPAGGIDVLTHGPALFLAGDNPGGIERVTVTPVSGRGTTHIAPGSGLTQFAGGTGAVGQLLRVVVPVIMDGIEVGRGAIEGTLDELQQRGILEGAI